jgi:hypothetical protein
MTTATPGDAGVAPRLRSSVELRPARDEGIVAKEP